MPTAILETSKGTFAIRLDLEHAPKTAGSFLRHAKAGNFDGTAFHRVAPGFVIQGGDMAPKGIRAERIAWEKTGLQNKRYTVSMARSGHPDQEGDSGTASSQFFINLRDNASLDGYKFPYVVFGTVVEGKEVVDAIGALAPAGRTSYDGPPTSPVTVRAVTIRD